MSEATDKNKTSSLAEWGGEVAVVGGTIELTKIEDLFALAKWICASGVLPSCYQKPEQVLVAIQTGSEVGLTPMASVNSIYVVHGTPAWRTRAARALVRKSGLLEPGTDIESGYVHGEKCTGKAKECVDDCVGWCTTHRRGMARPHRTEFTIGDARRAGLYPNSKEAAVWNKYPSRMLMHRAIGFELDDGFSEVMLGYTIQEAVEDWPQAAFRRQDGGQLPSGAVPAPDPLFAKDEGVMDAEVVDEKTGEVVDSSLKPGDVVQGERIASAEEKAETAEYWRKVRAGEPTIPERVCPLCKIDHPEDEECPPEPGADDAPDNVDQGELGLG